MLASRDFVSATAGLWSDIIRDINYIPIFKVARDILLALPGSLDSESAIRGLAQRALEIVTKKAALRHDLMGRIYHLLLLEAKYLGTYYTSIPAATLLLKVCLDPERWPSVDWSDPGCLKQFQIADLACGTGTLLMAASQAITDNFVNSSLRKGHPIEKDALRGLHKLIVEEVLHGYDVLPSAVHLTASTLALLAPEICFEKMRLYSLPMGQMQSGQIYLGSIDYITASTIRTQLDLMSRDDTGPDRAGDDERSVAPLPMLDLCVMNPPFVRSVGGNLLFGSIPDRRGAMQGELARRLRETALPASSTAGLGSVFTAVADRHVKEGGRMGLVLPAAIASGIAWGKTRGLIERGYVLELVVSSHHAGYWNFSENTDLSELLLVARKRRGTETNETTASASVQFLNLWRNPKTGAEALALGEAVTNTRAAHIGNAIRPTHGVSEVLVGARKYGELLELPWGELRGFPWLGAAFAQTEMVRAAWLLRSGAVYLPSRSRLPSVPICRLGLLASLGPDRRDIADGFTVTGQQTNYPAFMGHDADRVTTMQGKPNKWLLPRAHAAPGRPLRDVTLLWPRAGTIMVAERAWLITQRTLAVRMPAPALSNVWWPLRLKKANVSIEKIICLWLNSSLGLLSMIGHRVPTRGPWIQFKKPTVELLPVLDPRALDHAQQARLAAAYDSVSEQGLLPISKIATDLVRAAIDQAVSTVLGLPDLGFLRSMLGQEPIICDQPQVVSRGEEVLQLQLL
jgi:hypothetical protein